MPTFVDTFQDLRNFNADAFIAAAEPHVRDDVDIFAKKASALKAAAREEIKRAQLIANKAAEDSGELSDRDNRRIETLRKAASDLTHSAEKLEAHDAEQSTPQTRQSEPAVAEPSRQIASPERSRILNGSAKFQEIFGAHRRRSEWKSPAEFLAVVCSGLHDPRLIRPQAFGAETVGGDGGFLVPEQLMADVLDSSLQDELIRPRARVVPMRSSKMTLTAPDRHDRSTGSVGGFAGQWLDEGQEANQQTPKFNKIALNAHKFAVYAQASLGLAQDGLDFQTVLTATMSESLGFGLDGAFINGDGIGKPRGVLKAANVIVTPKESSQTAATITFKNLIAMTARLQPGSWRRAVWIASQTTLPELFRLVYEARDDAGAAISGEAVAAPVFSVASDGTYLLLGRPLLISEHAEQLGVQGDIALVDLSQYVIGLRAEAYLERSNAPGWTKGLIDFRLIVRVDGSPRVGIETTPTKGATVSPFVVLAARG